MWWHDLQIVAIARVVLLNFVAFVGLLAAEGGAARLINGHTPMWDTVGKACVILGMALTQIGSVLILRRAPGRRDAH